MANLFHTHRTPLATGANTPDVAPATAYERDVAVSRWMAANGPIPLPAGDADDIDALQRWVR